MSSSSSSSPSASSSSESSAAAAPSSSSQLQLLFQISPDLVQSESKIGAHVAFNRLYLAFVVDSCTLKLVAHEPSNHHDDHFSSSPLFAHAVLDSPHRDRAAAHQPQIIKCIKLSHLEDSSTSKSSCFLLSCASSSVLLWNMNEVFGGLGGGAVEVGEPGWFPRHDIHECAFHPSNKIVGVACRSGLVVVIDVERNVRLDQVVLDACVNVFEFARFTASSSSSLVLISSTETNLLVLHDFRSRSRRQLVRASSPSSSSSGFSLERSAIVDICGLDNEPLVVLGSSNGLLYVYHQNASDGHLTPVRQIDVRQFGFESSTKDDDDDDDSNSVLIGLDLISTGSDDHARQVIACASLHRIYVIDVHSGSLLASFAHYDPTCIPQRVDFCFSPRSQLLLASFLYVFKNEINVVKLMRLLQQQPLSRPESARNQNQLLNESFRIEYKANKSTLDGAAKTIEASYVRPSVDDIVLTVFPTLSLLESSPLNEPVVTSCKPKPLLSMQDYLKQSNSTLSSLGRSNLNKPITFSSKIKSSGYNSTTTTAKRFHPVINKSATSLSLTQLAAAEMDKKTKLMRHLSTTNSPAASVASSSSSLLSSSSQTEFRFRLPEKLKNKFTATDRSVPIVDLKFSSDGQRFALVSSDNLVQYMWSGNPEKPGLSLSAHQDVVNSIDMSHNGKYLISSSRDKSCKLWSLGGSATANNINSSCNQQQSGGGNGKLLLDIRSLDSSATNSKQHAPQSFEFKREPTCAQFFYLDKFMLIGSEKSLLVCKYHVDTRRNELQRYVNNSWCRVSGALEMSFSQTISCMAAVNSFYSYTVMCAGSNKDIEVLDLNEMRSCLCIHEAHSRAVTQLVLNPSPANQLSYDVFASNSVCDGVKLWDLRAPHRPLARLDAHLNRFLATKCSFSPHSLCLAAASEDRSVVVYDLRMISSSLESSPSTPPLVLKKYAVLSDAVSCALFNPRRSQLLCATLDGKLYNYLHD